jgi:Tol biopolymer transport system component
MSKSKELRIGAALEGRYTLIREIGHGGMATVFLARDLKHDRDVALKVLHRELGAVLGAERFLAEIRTTAQLHHPNILPLFDSGEADGLVFYVMPFVEGEALRERITKEGQLGVTEAVRITSEVADALEHAHKHGVIHRDIKPENILLQDGHALVADFGVAIAVSRAAGERITGTGFSIGTPQYMSPEQAAAERDIDGRSDQYSLASVLYELLVGEPPFTGPNTGAIMARMMSEQAPDVARRRPSVPETVAEALHRALEKVPGDRFPSVAAFGEAIAPPSRLTGTHRVASAAGRRTRVVPIALAGGCLLGIAAGIAYMSARREPEVVTGDITHVTTEDGLEIQPAISPDGKMMVYAAGTSIHVRLFLRPIDGGRAVSLTADSTTIQQEPRWSPSGNSILFLAGGGVDTVVAGLGAGSAVTLINGAQGPIATATWSPDGHRIAFVRRDSLMTYTIASGETRFVAQEKVKECSWSPRGDLIACGVPRDFSAIGKTMGNAGPSMITVVPARGGKPVAVTDSVSLNASPVWSPDGRRLYFVSNRNHQRDVYYVGVGSGGRARGEPHRLTTALNAASLSLSRDGRHLAYSVYTPQANIWSVPILPGAIATSAMATQVTFGHQLIESVFATPDGKTLFYDSDRNGNADIWRLAVGDSQLEAMTHDPADEFGPSLSPDGRRLAFYSYREGAGRGIILVKPMDGGPVEQVNTSATYGIWPEWKPDGRTLVWQCNSQGKPSQCTAIRDSVGRWHVEARPQDHANWSPDGRWTTSRRHSGNAPVDTVWIYAAGSDQARVLYGRRSPTEPRIEELNWSPDSRSLYFKSHDADGRAMFWSLPVEGGAPRLIARLDDLTHPSYRNDFAVGAGRIFFAVNDRQSDISVVELIER